MLLRQGPQRSLSQEHEGRRAPSALPGDRLAGFPAGCQEQPWKEGVSGELRLVLRWTESSPWQRNNLWGLTRRRAQMGFNECGDDNDDNYSNSFPSLHPREASAAFCHLTEFEK